MTDLKKDFLKYKTSNNLHLRMTQLFLKEKDKKEARENVQISTSPILNKTNITLKQETLCVVTITMIYST